MKRPRKRRFPAPATNTDPARASAMHPYLVAFLEAVRVKGLSEKTVVGRDSSLAAFIRWCQERGLDRPQDVTRPVLERYRRHLFHLRKDDGEPLSFATQRHRLSHLRGFFQWLTRENHLLSNPASELELPRRHRQLPRHVLGVDEIERVLAQTLLHGELGVRDRAIIETLYSTGIRRTELTRLSLYDVETKNGTLLVREGKGRKDRFVPLGQRACRWIERYRDEVRPSLVLEPDRGILFLHEYGEAFSHNRLGDLVKKYLLAAGVTVPGSCHLFRHAMATHMLNNGADVRFLQAILGHSQLSTTEIYTHVAIAKLQEVHARTHPASLPPQPRRHEDADESDAAELLFSLAAEADVESQDEART
jgi:integrase/recombinase XerD